MSRVSPEYRDARRAHIIAVARELFSSKGLAHTSMADLVAAAGMSMGAFYRYFDGKDELIAAVAEGRDGTVEGDFPVTETPGELVGRLLAYVSEPHGAAHARLVAQIWGDAAVRPELAKIVRARHTALRDHLVERVHEHEATRPEPTTPDEAEPADVTADVVLAALIGYALLVASGFDADPAQFQRTLGTLLPTAQPKTA